MSWLGDQLWKAHPRKWVGRIPVAGPLLLAIGDRWADRPAGARLWQLRKWLPGRKRKSLVVDHVRQFSGVDQGDVIDPPSPRQRRASERGRR